jgi:hypothetical protein
MASFFDSRSRLQIPIDAGHLFRRDAGRAVGTLKRARENDGSNVIHQRTGESLCRPITRICGGGEEPTCAHAGSVMASGSTAAS